MSEEQAQKLLYQMQTLETYFADLIQKENTLINVLREARSAIESIMSLGEKLESDTLMPIGMGIYIKTKIISNQNVVINMGSGIAMEKNKTNAINYLEHRIKEIETAIKNTAIQKQDVALKLEQGKQEINRLTNVSKQKNTT